MFTTKVQIFLLLLNFAGLMPITLIEDNKTQDNCFLP